MSMHPVSAVLLSLLALATGASSATQVHRCEHAGAVTFSDRACDTGSRATSKTYAAGGPSGALDMQVAVKHYEVRGSDYSELVRSLMANGPRGFHGLARWNVSYQFNTERSTERPQPMCVVGDVRVRVVGDILMPRWVDIDRAPLELQRRWQDHIAALQRHEEGHIQHGRELALLVKERLMGLGSVDCERLPALAKGEFERLYDNLKNRDREYDQRTRHGATQGAVF